MSAFGLGLLVGVAVGYALAILAIALGVVYAKVKDLL